MTEEKFLSGIAMLYSIFGKKIGDDALKIYWNILKKHSDEQFANMLDKLIGTFIPTLQVPFPLPAHFTQAIGLSGENRAQAAVTAVKNAVERWGAWSSVDFGDGALHATINRFGGWPEVCSWGNSGQWQYNEKKFIEAYQAAAACGESAGSVEGNFEIGNRGKNQEDWSPVRKLKHQESIALKKIEWIGSNFNLITNKKSHEQKMIPEIKNIVDGIGKKM